MFKGFWRWFWVLAAAPAGAAAGFICGYYLAYGILVVQGMGNSHNDMYACVFSGALGMLVGALLLPIIAWVLTRGRQQ
jgi:hypothetical protein